MKAITKKKRPTPKSSLIIKAAIKAIIDTTALNIQPPFHHFDTDA
jgi:hypothetical protein